MGGAASLHPAARPQAARLGVDAAPPPHRAVRLLSRVGLYACAASYDLVLQPALSEWIERAGVRCVGVGARCRALSREPSHLAVLDVLQQGLAVDEAVLCLLTYDPTASQHRMHFMVIEERTAVDASPLSVHGHPCTCAAAAMGELLDAAFGRSDGRGGPPRIAADAPRSALSAHEAEQARSTHRLSVAFERTHLHAAGSSGAALRVEYDPAARAADEPAPGLFYAIVRRHYDLRYRAALQLAPSVTEQLFRHDKAQLLERPDQWLALQQIAFCRIVPPLHPNSHPAELRRLGVRRDELLGQRARHEVQLRALEEGEACARDDFARAFDGGPDDSERHSQVVNQKHLIEQIERELQAIDCMSNAERERWSSKPSQPIEVAPEGSSDGFLLARNMVHKTSLVASGRSDLDGVDATIASEHRRLYDVLRDDRSVQCGRAHQGLSGAQGDNVYLQTMRCFEVKHPFYFEPNGKFKFRGTHVASKEDIDTVCALHEYELYVAHHKLLLQVLRPSGPYDACLQRGGRTELVHVPTYPIKPYAPTLSVDALQHLLAAPAVPRASSASRWARVADALCQYLSHGPKCGGCVVTRQTCVESVLDLVRDGLCQVYPMAREGAVAVEQSLHSQANLNDLNRLRQEVKNLQTKYRDTVNEARDRPAQFTVVQPLGNATLAVPSATPLRVDVAKVCELFGYFGKMSVDEVRRAVERQIAILRHTIVHQGVEHLPMYAGYQTMLRVLAALVRASDDGRLTIDELASREIKEQE